MKEDPFLVGKYHSRHRWMRAILQVLDACLIPSKKKKLPEAPKKILLANLAHLGDLVIASSVLPHLKAKFPKARIGFLVGSSSKPLLENHPDIAQFHTLDHWKFNRSEPSKRRRFQNYFKQRRQIIKEIKEQKYDLFIDLYPFFPPSIPLARAAKVPNRLGFINGGFGAWLTCPVDWRGRNTYISESYKELLKPLNIYPEILKPSLPPEEPIEGLPDAYVVLHLGAGHPKKEWALDKWKHLVSKIPHRIVFTGKGAKENRAINEILKSAKYGMSLCDQLTLAQMSTLLKHAKTLISVDSFPVHLAALHQTPTLIISRWYPYPKQWTPLHEKTFLFRADEDNIDQLQPTLMTK